MTNIKDELQKTFKGDIDETDATREIYSHDASLFEIKPQVVIFPKDAEDIKAAVKFVSANKASNPLLAITPRSAGTDMSGGAIGGSIVMDFTRYMNKIIEVTPEHAVVLPGCFYRDMEKEALKIDRFMPAYTASKEINAVGGMIANNSGGEKAIKYGKVENFIESLKVVFSDGNEYTIKPLSKAELEAKIKENTFESQIYQKIWDLIQNNLAEIKAAKPDVSKNSAGYYLWNVWNEETFDLCQLICGSQGTLGIVSEISWKLVPTEPFANLLAVFMPDIKNLGKVVAEITPFKPDSLETYDDYSMKLAVKFFFDFFKSLGFWGAIKLGFKFIPEAWMLVTGGVPKLILLVEIAGQNQEEVKNKLTTIMGKIKHFGYKMHIAKDQAEANKYWRIRRESFNMLRKHVHGQRTAPFIDDIIVKPEYLPEFLPKIEKEIDSYKLVYTIAGHAGNGNFHIIPLMDLDSPISIDTILELSKKIYTLVHEYKGSITAEHNDGIIRTPFLTEMYGAKIVSLFKETKDIFDPLNILNPGKKVGGTFEDIKTYIKKKN
ncbi:MAG: FAD-binding oxidoreductase [Candidatus Paceibacterota bacterium]|jgi:FAD/FMN-containing dehydrogenase